MLNNFLEHTRCPEAAIRPFLTEGGATSRLDSKVASPTAAQELVQSLQRSANAAGTRPAQTLADIDDVISVLRWERYIDSAMSSSSQSGLKSLVRQAYYMMRPLFPVSFRKYLQRIALQGWDSIPFPAWPVDLTTENLMEAMWRILLKSQGLQELPFIWFWPDGHSSACIMTHDVETGAGRDFCGTMMQMEKRRGITSAFEVVPEERYAVPDEFLEEIREGGCEICIHGLNHDGHLFSSETVFFERAKKINVYAESWGALGFRSPVLYRNLSWLYALNFSYDMSVPNVGHLDPQRGGCCTVMPYFIGNILEVPLTTIQDYSLFNILQQRTLDLWIKQIGMIREKHGLISFIIHPDYVNEHWSSNVYNRLLGYLGELRSDHGVWIALPREVDRWWRDRRGMQLIQQDGRWRIVGPQAERARVAYASLENGSVVYKVDKDIAVATEA